MKKTFLCALFVFVSTFAEARQVSGFVEEWNTVTKSGTTPEINVYLAGPLKGKVGWTSWSLITESWSESTFGLTFAPAKWVEVSASIGIETDEDPFRQAATLWMGKGRFAFFSVQEHGGSGYWYRYLGTYKVSGTVDVGVSSIRFFGNGPYVSKSFGKVSLWGTYAVDENAAVVTARFSF